ncbi:dihydropteroate synthase [Streptomyces sp. NPDC021080]|uniref:dihydropteroate synthase n=1 Tax=Streptomyces sp. NPDC021080 TaxID=3365110 RepID=UPI0037990EE5
MGSRPEPSNTVPAGIRRPAPVGIVDITAASFSDGNRFLTAHAAVAHARKLCAEGADAIELGLATSRPGSRQVPPDEEMRRPADVIDELVAEGVPVSVDSCRPATQRFTTARGAAYLDDIQRFDDPTRYEELAGTACRLVVVDPV